METYLKLKDFDPESSLFDINYRTIDKKKIKNT